jgi:heme A synthase
MAELVHSPGSARWVHALAVFTALAALPLLFLGAEVTTKQVGMVDPVWPTQPLYLFVEGTAWERGVGFLIEHGHRLAGWTVGACAILLTVGVWKTEPRRWVRWLALAVLVGVSCQGILGGLRVRLNAYFGTDLALIHGCFGQLVFSLLVSLAMCTSRRWNENSTDVLSDSASLRRWSLLVTGLLILQLVLGAFVRHRGLAIAQRGHLLVAFAAIAAVTWLVKVIWDNYRSERSLVGAARVLAVVVLIQIALGIEAWMVKFGSMQVMEPGHWLFNRDLVRTCHVLGGAILLATSVVVTLRAHQTVVESALESAAAPLAHLEEAA